MKFGCTTSVRQYGQLKNSGFDYAELSCREVVSLSEAEFYILTEKVSREVPVYAMNAYCPPEIVIAGPGFDVKRAREYALGAAERAADLGVQRIGIGSPMSRSLPPTYSRNRATEELISFLTVTADVFGSAGIQVCVEALSQVYCNFVNTLDEAVGLVKAIRHPWLKVVLDFYNMEHEGQGDMSLEFARSFITHAHISDDEDRDPRRRSYLQMNKADIHRRRISRLAALETVDSLSLEIDVPFEEPRAAASLQTMRAGYHDYLDTKPRAELIR